MTLMRFTTLCGSLGCLLAASASAVPSALWTDYVDARANGTEPTLPDFSYAGYHRSQAPLPTVSGPIFDVTAYGAVPDDNRSDRDAIQAAIVAAENAGGGVVYFPSGRFHLNTLSEVGSPIRIRRSNIVLRGAGVWEDPTELYMEAPFEPENPDQMYSTPEMFLVQPSGSTSSSTLATINAPAERESFSVEVVNPAALQVGQWVCLYLRDPDAAAPFLAPKELEPEWTQLTDEGLKVEEKHQIVAIDGNVVTFAEPIHMEIDPTYDWSLRTYPHIEEVGFENIVFRGNWVSDFVHHRSARDDSAWSALQINNVVNGWITRCRFINWNEAVNLHDTSFFTLALTRIEGNGGHFGIHTRRGNGILATYGADTANQWHGPSVGYQSAGAVFHRYTYGSNSSFDAHGSGPYATLLDANEGGLLRGRTGGTQAGQPNHLRWLTLWNFEQTNNAQSNYYFWDENNANTRDRFLFPIIAGFHGAATTFETDDLQVLESLGTPVEPESLFEAQLTDRQGSVPSFMSTWAAEWTQWEAQPAETVVRISNQSQLEDGLEQATPGTTIVIADGVYVNQNWSFDGKDSANGTGGTATHPIRLRAETPGGVAFIGQSSLEIDGAYMEVEGLLFTKGTANGAVVSFASGSRHCAFRNSAIVDYNPDSSSTDYDWISVRGQFNAITDNQLSGMTHKGVQLVVILDESLEPNGTHIARNYFADRAPGTGNGYETIRIGTSDRSMLNANALVEHNLFHHTDGEIETISNKSVGNVYRGNTFLESAGQLTLRHGSACTVDGNFFIGNGYNDSGGVRVVGPDHVVINNYFSGLSSSSELRGAIVLMNGVPNSPLNRYLQAENVTIAHNTVVNSARGIVIGTTSSEGDTTLPPQNNTIVNNVVAGSNNPYVEVTAPIGHTYAANVSSTNVPNLPSGFTFANPMFAEAADGLQRPQPGSALIDAAVDSVAAATLDMDGQTRPATGRDIGADEVLPGAIKQGPLEPGDVGPSWQIVIPDDPGGVGDEGFNEPFSYNDGPLNGNGRWIEAVTTATRDSESSDAMVVSELALKLYNNPAAMPGTVVAQIFEDESVTAGHQFLSFYFTVNALPTDGAAAGYLIGFSDSTGAKNRARLWLHQQDADSGTYRLGVTAKSGSSFQLADYPEALEVGQTYQVLIEHEYNSSESISTLYVDPVTLDDPHATNSSTGDSGLSSVFIHQSAAAIAEVTIDHLQVQNNFEAALAPLRDRIGGTGIRGYPMWFTSPALGTYYRVASGHLWYPQLGWLWPVPSESGDSLYIYDFETSEWWWTSGEVTPWFYRFGDEAGWVFVFENSTADNRRIYVDQ
ncbi:MAG: chondroitinase-B domain-containing protein [Verrucomicrobiota bacterium JB022]|nr:chondroitinase-B domain-containing protein [Verrucomicrobiota bacterium JB022]